MSTHLLEGLTTRGDVLRDADFSDLGRFFFPLASEMDAQRDNVSSGIWNGSDSSVWSILHHLKCFSAAAGPDGKRMEGKDPNCTLQGLRLERATHSLGPKANVWVEERRISIAVLAADFSSSSTPETDVKRYNALCVVSPGGQFKRPDPLETSKALGIRQTSGHWAPVVCFLAVFGCASRTWYEYWDTFLDAVDMFEDDVSSIDSKGGGVCLFRNSSTNSPKNTLLQHQRHNGPLRGGAKDEETCLEVARLLRRAARWIRNTQRDFQRTRYEIMDEEPRKLPGTELMGSNWDNVERILEERSSRLVYRIDRLVKEFEDVRQQVR